MEMAKRAEQFRAAVKQLGSRGKTTPYPRALRATALSYLRARQASGRSVYRTARELGLGVDTLRRWAEAAGQRPSPRTPPGFQRVDVVASGAATARGGIVAYAPSGIRIEGFDVVQLADLLRRLG